jgi:hypothetical protein
MYPPSPWELAGDLWLSLFRVSGVPGRPDGVYGAAFVRYTEPGQLAYDELLVARVARGPDGRGASVTDIWVDSVASMAGGRDLWAIPKDLCDFDHDRVDRGWAERTAWRATLAGQPLAAATFTDVSRRLPRVPVRGRTCQWREDGSPVAAGITGSARVGPARGRWTFAPQGPLGFLAGRRSLGSWRLSAFSMTFGSRDHNRV